MTDAHRTRHSSFIMAALVVVLLVVTGPHAQAAKSDLKAYEQFGSQLTDSLIAGDQAALLAAMDKAAIMERIFEGITEDKKTAAELRKGLDQGLDKLPGILVSQFQDRAALKFVRARNLKGSHYALVRVDFGDQGLNYMDFMLEKDPSGAIKIVDWYDYVKGQYYTDSVRQIIALALPKDRNLVQKLLGMDKVEKKEIKLYSQQLQLLKNGDYEGWLKKYHALPPRMQESRIILLTRSMAANLSGNDREYASALKDLYRHFGDDPTLGLMLLDHFYLEGDYKAARKSLKDLNEYTGGDAAIDNLMAKMWQAEKGYDESIKYARKAIKSDPEFVDAYFTLLDSSAYAGNYKDAVANIEKLEKDFGYDFDAEILSGLEGYEGFAASKEFKQWRKKKGE